MAQTSFEVETVIEAPPERVYAAMIDPDSFPKWMEGLVGIERLTEGPTVVGTQFRETRRMYGQEASELFENTALEPNQKLSLYVDGSKGSSKKGEYFFDDHFVPEGNGTRIRMTGDIRVPGFFAAIFLRLFKGMFKKGCVKDLDSLKRWLESGD